MDLFSRNEDAWWWSMICDFLKKILQHSLTYVVLEEENTE